MITNKYYKLIRVSYADEGYFCLTNVGNGVGTVSIGTAGSINYEYSTDGVTWTSYTGGTEINVDPKSNIYWRYAGSGNNISGKTFNLGFDCYASGNLMSLYSKDNFNAYTGDWGAKQLFYNQTHLLRANFSLGAATTIGAEDMHRAFYGCQNLTEGPDFSHITTIETGQTPPYYGGLQEAFYDCRALCVTPDFSSLTSVGRNAFNNAFYQCFGLTSTPNFTNVTSVSATGFLDAFFYCRNLTTAYAPTITWDTGKMAGWLNYVLASGTLYADSSIASTIPTSNPSGCPSGWTVATL